MNNYIIRKGNKKNFEYFFSNNLKIKDKKTLDKIKEIYIPPAYTNVKIYLNNDILATGLNNAGRKQYIYSEEMKKKREIKKCIRLKIVAQNIKKLKYKVSKDLQKEEFTKNKLIALLLKIMELCNFRNGSKKYEKLYGSHGLITLHKKHISVEKDFVEIDFIGKKGVLNNCLIKNKNIKEIIKKVYHLSSKEDPYLFSIRNNNKTIKILITDINKYLKEYKIRCKDLRMWNANILFLKNLKKERYNIMNKKKLISLAIKKTAISLHHTPTICKKSYILKEILEEVENKDIIMNKLEDNEKIEDILKKFIRKL